MTYESAEQFLLSVSNLPKHEYMGDAHLSDIYLKRMRFLLDILGNPEQHMPHVIHVGGTSGKGSLVTMLHSILVRSGARVASMISPHPTHLLERWRVGTRIMTKKEFVELVSILKPALDTYARTSPYGHLSFFDLTTAIGFLFFKQQNITWAVVEVGCGGEFDSTNVLPKKDIAVITTVGLDHMEILGHTKEAIATTKAGIITPGADVFTMEKNKKIQAMLKKRSQEKKASFHVSNSTYQTSFLQGMKTVFTYRKQTYTLNTIGEHQVNNAILAIQIAETAHIKPAAIRTGLFDARFPICMEAVQTRPLVILDGAHNPDKIATTVSAMQALLDQKKRRVHLILGFSENKRINPMMKRLLSLKPASVAATRNTTHLFRMVADPKRITTYIKKASPSTKTELFLDPRDALRWAKKQAKKDDIILVTGSIYLAGEMRGTS